jgi:hypothetical protein
LPLRQPPHQPVVQQASSAPYWVGVKNGFVVTWHTKTNFQAGVLGKVPTAPVATAGSSVQPARRADAASEALTRPVPAAAGAG